MAQFAGPIQVPLGSVQGCPEVRNAVIATTTVEFLTDSSNRTLKIAGILPRHGGVQGGEEEEQQFLRTPIYIVYAHGADSGLFWRSTSVGRALQHLREVSVPNDVCELCDRCFYECKSLRRVLFGSSSSLERIGVACFAYSGVEAVTIPDGVRELCGGCFYKCRSLGCVTFGSSSSLERIGDSCFYGSGVEDVSIADGVRELCDRCFEGCGSLRRVTFGCSSSLERIGVSCFQDSGIEEVRIPAGVRELCDRWLYRCGNLRCVSFDCPSALEKMGV